MKCSPLGSVNSDTRRSNPSSGSGRPVTAAAEAGEVSSRGPREAAEVERSSEPAAVPSAARREMEGEEEGGAVEAEEVEGG